MTAPFEHFAGAVDAADEPAGTVGDELDPARHDAQSADPPVEPGAAPFTDDDAAASSEGVLP